MKKNDVEGYISSKREMNETLSSVKASIDQNFNSPQKRDHFKIIEYK